MELDERPPGERGNTDTGPRRQFCWREVGLVHGVHRGVIALEPRQIDPREHHKVEPAPGSHQNSPHFTPQYEGARRPRSRRRRSTGVEEDKNAAPHGDSAVLNFGPCTHASSCSYYTASRGPAIVTLV